MLGKCSRPEPELSVVRAVTTAFRPGLTIRWWFRTPARIKAEDGSRAPSDMIAYGDSSEDGDHNGFWWITPTAGLVPDDRPWGRRSLRHAEMTLAE